MKEVGKSAHFPLMVSTFHHPPDELRVGGLANFALVTFLCLCKINTRLRRDSLRPTTVLDDTAPTIDFIVATESFPRRSGAWPGAWLG
ncbi:hypothetical protein DFH06DRAFT_1317601 [Mycena polygramma]|nr:hypothetical protein DFH06DRAFT_1317601 [Mycena polygramma]